MEKKRISKKEYLKLKNNKYNFKKGGELNKNTINKVVSICDGLGDDKILLFDFLNESLNFMYLFNKSNNERSSLKRHNKIIEIEQLYQPLLDKLTSKSDRDFLSYLHSIIFSYSPKSNEETNENIENIENLTEILQTISSIIDNTFVFEENQLKTKPLGINSNQHNQTKKPSRLGLGLQSQVNINKQNQDFLKNLINSLDTNQTKSFIIKKQIEPGKFRDMITQNYINIYNRRGSTLGTGSFGTIKLNVTGNYYLPPDSTADSTVDSTQLTQIAIKYLNDYNEYLHELYIYKHLNTLKHCDKIITKMYTYESNIIFGGTQVHAIVLERARYTLNHIYDVYINKKNNIKIFLEMLFNTIQKLSSGLEYIHSKNIVHCDLKPANIGIFKNSTPKLFDFGQSHTKATIEKNYTVVSLSGGTHGFKLYSILAYRDFLGYITDSTDSTEISMEDRISLIFKILKINDIWALIITLISILSNETNSPANLILMLCINGHTNMPLSSVQLRFYYDIPVYQETDITSEALCNSCDRLLLVLMEEFRPLLNSNKSQFKDKNNPDINHFEKYNTAFHNLVENMFEILKIICSFKILYETKTTLEQKITRLDEIYEELQHKLKNPFITK